MDYFSDDGEAKCFCYLENKSSKPGSKSGGRTEPETPRAAFASKAVKDRSTSPMSQATVLAEYSLRIGSDNYFSEKDKRKPGRFSMLSPQRAPVLVKME
jgi:hypothetical protein